jgi:hypothetical protein
MSPQLNLISLFITSPYLVHIIGRISRLLFPELVQFSLPLFSPPVFCVSTLRELPSKSFRVSNLSFALDSSRFLQPTPARV